MSRVPKVLVCLDPDRQASVFDSVVAVDAGVDHLLRHGGVEPGQVRDLVYGAMFTRGGADLAYTAIFIGGSQARAAEQLLLEVVGCFFGKTRVSVMLDPNGANTTAAAAVLSLAGCQSLEDSLVTVLAGTGPVGQRVARLLARRGAAVRIGSRDLERAAHTCHEIRDLVPQARLEPRETGSFPALWEAVRDASAVVACGAPGVELLPDEVRQRCENLQVVVDLNAVPPMGIGGLQAADAGVARPAGAGEQICFGALGVGRKKMEIHRRAIASLFESNDRVLDAEEIYSLGESC